MPTSPISRIRPRYSLLDDPPAARSGSQVPPATNTEAQAETPSRASTNPFRTHQQQGQHQQSQSRTLDTRRPPSPPSQSPPPHTENSFQAHQARATRQVHGTQQPMMTLSADSDKFPEHIGGMDLSEKPGRGDDDDPAFNAHTKGEQAGDWVNGGATLKKAPGPPSEFYYDEPLDITEATAHDLTNAANTILIPPLFYPPSRAPPQPLAPRRPIPDAETGQQHAKYEDALDRHMLGRPSAFRQAMQGVWEFLKTPKGIIAAIYGFLVAFWGSAIVLFLTKMINLHDANKQGQWVEISSQVENGLFTLTGIGMIPFRAIDTYHIVKIWQIKRQMARLRSSAGLPQVVDEDDLPDPALDPNYVPLLTLDEQEALRNHQIKFQRSQTWYRPYATETNRAFPTHIALIICCLNAGNSAFQILLCATMWGLNRFERPPWTTGLLIPCAFGCAIGAAVLVWRGGRATRRSEADKRVHAVMSAGAGAGVVVGRRRAPGGEDRMPLVRAVGRK